MWKINPTIKSVVSYDNFATSIFINTFTPKKFGTRQLRIYNTRVIYFKFCFYLYIFI